MHTFEKGTNKLTTSSETKSISRVQKQWYSTLQIKQEMLKQNSALVMAGLTISNPYQTGMLEIGLFF